MDSGGGCFVEDVRSGDFDGRGDVELWAYLRLVRGTCTDRWE